LRAVAVVGVLVNHAWPARLGGGYAGVDVFFVISGFLITSHLMRHLPRTGLDLAAFWSRRIRRLLPAALLTLLVTVAGSWWLEPRTAWIDTARMARAAATYWVNWLLAHDAVDYFAADNAATPIQHFWSLSLEEQFYAVWPVLLLTVGWLTWAATRRRTHRSMPVLFAVLATVVAASYAYSVIKTGSDPAAAYFISTTRVWELGVGALLAVGVAWRAGRPAGGWWAAPWARGLLAWAGLAAIAVTFWRFGATTEFPGYAAALPVLGTAAVIGAHVDPASLLARVFALRPIQWLGDVSYSLYLWHWPALLLGPYLIDRIHANGHPGVAGWREKLVLIAAALLAAGLSRRVVEDPVRRWRPRLRLRWVYAAAAAGMAVIAAVSTGQITITQNQINHELAQARAAVGGPCYGAAAMAPGAHCPPSTYQTLKLPPAAAKIGFSAFWAPSDCPLTHPGFNGKPACTLGVADGPQVTLVGNSHAGQYIGAFASIATKHGWHMDVDWHPSCVLGVKLAGALDNQKDCPASNAWTMNRLAQQKPELIVVSNEAYNATAATAAQVLRTWTAAGSKVIVIRDNPGAKRGTPAGHGFPACVEAHPDALDSCVASPRPDPWAEAADTGIPGVKVVDLTSYYCTDAGVCPGVIGDLIVYSDDIHVADSYMRTLSPYLDTAIQATGYAPNS